MNEKRMKIRVQWDDVVIRGEPNYAKLVEELRRQKIPELVAKFVVNQCKNSSGGDEQDA